VIITQIRDYKQVGTHGELFVNGSHFGKTIEDTARPSWVKIPGHTCIPEGVYSVTITQSQRFGKPMLLLYNRADFSVQDGVRFTGIRVHAGTTVDHTDGCIMLANYPGLQTQIEKALGAGESVLWVISSRR
jgi:hypothetical protein